MNEGGKKKYSLLAQEMPIEKILKTSSATREGPYTAEGLVIDMTSFNGKKNKAARSEPMAPAMSRMASTIADEIAQRRGPVMPRVPKYVPRRPLGARSGSPLERLAIMKSDKVDSAAKVAPRPTLPAAETDSPARRRRLLEWATVRNPLSLLLGRLLRSVHF